jgi:hypothetical protein
MPDWEELRKSVQVNITFEPELVGVERMSDDAVKKLWNSVQSKRSIEIEDAEIIGDDE